MTGFKQHWTTKGIALILALGLLWGGQSIFPQETDLEGLFKWAIKNYREGKYREVSKDLELLLSYCSEDHKQLKGKIHLLLGAVHEQLGNLQEAQKNYRLSLEFETYSIEELDLTFLEEYQRTFMNKQKPVKPGIIEKPKAEPKKKKTVNLLLVLGGVVAAGAAVLLVLKKNKPQYTLTIVEIGQGNVALDPAGGKYSEGTEVTLEAIPDAGWIFENWSGTLSDSENPTRIIMGSNKIVWVIFRMSTNGTVQPNPTAVLSRSGEGTPPGQ